MTHLLNHLVAPSAEVQELLCLRIILQTQRANRDRFQKAFAIAIPAPRSPTRQQLARLVPGTT